MARTEREITRALSTVSFLAGTTFVTQDGGRFERESLQILLDLADEVYRLRRLEEAARATVAAWEEIPKITPWPLSTGLSRLRELLKEDQ